MGPICQVERTDREWVPDQRLPDPPLDQLAEASASPDDTPLGAGLPTARYRPILVTRPYLTPRTPMSTLLGHPAASGPRARAYPGVRPVHPVTVMALPVDSPMPDPATPRDIVTDPTNPAHAKEWLDVVACATKSPVVPLIRYRLDLAAGVQGAQPPASLDTLTHNSLTTEIIAGMFSLHGQPQVARRVRSCGQLYRAVRVKHRPGCDNDTGEIHVQRSQCGVLGCPVCQGAIARHKARRLAGSLAVAWVDQPKGGRYARHLVLTIRSGLQTGASLTAASINAAVRHAKQVFTQWWTSYVKPARWSGKPGAFYKIEVGSQGNVHLHVATIGMRYIDQKWLSSTWEASGGDPVVWVTACYTKGGKARKSSKAHMNGVAGMVHEVAKYIAKPAAGGAWWLAPLVGVALWNVRVTESYGALRGIAASVDHWIRYRYRSCEQCGSQRHVAGRWQRSPEIALDSLSSEELRPRAPPRDDVERKKNALLEQYLGSADRPDDQWSVPENRPHRPTIDRAAAKAVGFARLWQQKRRDEKPRYHWFG